MGQRCFSGLRKSDDMQLEFDTAFSARYTSKSQRARVLTEHWARSNGFCPVCGLTPSSYANNQPVADLYCSACQEDFELKSQGRPISGKIADGAYSTMVERLTSNRNPNLFLLHYSATTWNVQNFLVVPKYFFTPDMIEKRPPLPASARRAGWIGCNISLREIPSIGKIPIVKDGVVQPKSAIIDSWKNTSFLASSQSLEARGWLLDVMKCTESIGKSEFSLTDMYRFIGPLQEKYPRNRHIKEKIRQQLQVLRNNGYLSFAGKGLYRLNSKTVAQIRSA